MPHTMRKMPIIHLAISNQKMHKKPAIIAIIAIATLLILICLLAIRRRPPVLVVFHIL
jgi:hypothetical protein